MAEDDLLASDYDDPCALCEEDEEKDFCRYKEDERANLGEINSDNEEEVDEDELTQVFRRNAEATAGKPITEDRRIGHGAKKRKLDLEKEEDHEADEQNIIDGVDEAQNSADVQGQNKVAHNSTEDSQTYQTNDDVDKNSRDLDIPPLEDDCILQMGPGCTIDLVMVCEQSVERCLSEEMMLCPSRSSDAPQLPIQSSPKPSSMALPPPNAMVPFHPPSALQPQVPRAGTFETQSLGNPAFGSSGAVETQAMMSTGQLEVTLRQVYTTRRFSHFASRTTPLLPLPPMGGEATTQALPSMSSEAPLMPQRKKTRTFYSMDQLEELERVFQDDHYPDGDKRKEIASSIGVTPQRIMVWFQNRRAKWKKTTKSTTKKAPASRGKPPVPVNRPPVFTGSTVAPPHLKQGNTLPPYSTFLNSNISSAVPAYVDVGPCVSQGGFLEYLPPPFHSPPPIQRASLPLITTYNPPTHSVSLLLDTPEHSESSSSDATQLSLQTDSGFEYDRMSSSVKLDLPSTSQNNSFNYQLNAYPQHANSFLAQATNPLLPHPNALLSQQSGGLMPQQASNLLPQYSHLSYLTPSPYLTPSEGNSAPYLPITTTANNPLPPYSSAEHPFLQPQPANQMLLGSGMNAFQTYPWTTDAFSQSGPFPRPLYRPQLQTQDREGLYSHLLTQPHYIQLQGASQPSLSKPNADPLLPDVKAEPEEARHAPVPRASETEPPFQCDFSPIHF